MKKFILLVLIDLVTLLFICPLAFSYISAWTPWLIIPIVLYINYKLLISKNKKNEKEN